MEMIDDLNDGYYLALPPGTRLFEYRIERPLGQGGFGITYLATDTLLDEQVAIKEFFPNESAVRTRELTARPKSPHDRESFRTGLETFLGEARIIARFRHINIMQVRRFFEMHGTGYIVMQYEAGRSFDEVMTDAALPETVLLPIFSGILDGLDILHDRAILHRDIKPKNVIIRDDGTPVLIDFGAARDFTRRDSQTVTKMASPGYSPPEQYGVGHQQGPWSDFYALGATMYRAVTGIVPVDSLRRLRNDPLRPAVEMAEARYGKPLLEIIDCMMRMEEARRPASVAEIRAALAPQASTFFRDTRRVDRKALPPKPAPDLAVAVKGLRRSRTWLFGGLGVGAACAVLGGLALVLLRAVPIPATTTVPPIAALKPTDHPGPIAAEMAPRAAPILQDCPTCPELVVVPAGTYAMGSDDGFPNETPIHSVTIAASFAIGRRPVTFAEWDACVEAGGCNHRPSDQGWGRGSRPVVDVSWNDANAYAGWLSQKTGWHYRLPSEAEWEYAARAGTTTAYWWGAAVEGGQALCADCLVPAPTGTQPTARSPANAFGLFDMAGNAAEWVADCWTDSYADGPADGHVVNAADCAQHSLRGGSFKSDARYIRAAARSHYGTILRAADNGFRIVRGERTTRTAE